MDLHGGPGSQNGFDNSGKRGEVHWHEGENPDRTVRILGKVAMMVKQWIDEGAFKLDTLGKKSNFTNFFFKIVYTVRAINL